MTSDLGFWSLIDIVILTMKFYTNDIFQFSEYQTLFEEYFVRWTSRKYHCINKRAYTGVRRLLLGFDGSNHCYSRTRIS